jgi:hypothetical protein
VAEAIELLPIGLTRLSEADDEPVGAAAGGPAATAPGRP